MWKSDLQQDRASSLWRRHLSQARIHTVDNTAAVSVTQVGDDGRVCRVMPKKMGRVDRSKRFSNELSSPNLILIFASQYHWMILTFEYSHTTLNINSYEWLWERQNYLMLTSKTIAIKCGVCLLICRVASKIVIPLLFIRSLFDSLKFNPFSFSVTCSTDLFGIFNSPKFNPSFLFHNM